MIYSKIVENNNVLVLAADLEKFLHQFNIQPNEYKRILYILQSESCDSEFNTRWHGTITIIYEAKYKIMETSE